MKSSWIRTGVAFAGLGFVVAVGACSDDKPAATTADAASTPAATTDGGAPATGTPDAAASASGKLGGSTGSWMEYMVMDNPAMGIGGTVEVTAVGTGTRFKLAVTGVKAGRPFGAHVHSEACDSNMAGGHYQHRMRPTDKPAFDSEFANDKNEVWLDFTSDASGKGSAEVTTGFAVDKARAKAVVVHTNATGDGGVAGTKLACINLKFD